MRIRIVGPAARCWRTDSEGVKAEFQQWAGPGTEVEHTQASKGPTAIESSCDIALATPFVVQETMRAQTEGVHAVIISCGFDPGLYAAREVCSIPVVGPLESQILVAQSLGDRFSVITLVQESVFIVRKTVHLYGFSHRLASIRPVGIGALCLDNQDPTLLDRVIDVGRLCVKEDNAHVLVLGGGRLSDLHVDAQAELGVPVLDPRGPAMHLAQLLARLRSSH